MATDYFQIALDGALAVQRRLEQERGAWHDPRSWTTAIAPLDHVTIAQFALDHDTETARLLVTGPRECRGTGLWLGVTAEIEPFCEVQHPDWLAGLDLRLLSHPFIGRTAYRIIGNEPRC